MSSTPSLSSPVTWAAALEEDGALGHLEDGVGGGIALLDLTADFAVELVAHVLGFPEAVALFPVVEEGAVNGDAAFGAFHPVLADEGPMESAAVAGQHVVKGAADGAFVVEVELAEAAENFVIALDQLVAGFDGEGKHWTAGV